MIVPECAVTHDQPPLNGAGGGVATSCGLLLWAERSSSCASLLLNSSRDDMRLVASGFLGLAAPASVEGWPCATGAATATCACMTGAGATVVGAGLARAGVSGAAVGKSRHSSM